MCSLLLHDMINHLVWAYISVSVSICQVMYGNKQAQNSIIFRKKNGFLTLQVHYRLLEQSLLVLVTQRRGTHTQAYPVVAQGSLNSRECLQRDGLRNLCQVPSQVSPPVTLCLECLFAARCRALHHVFGVLVTTDNLLSRGAWFPHCTPSPQPELQHDPQCLPAQPHP